MNDSRRKLQTIIERFDTAMLVTTSEDDLIRARPMRIAAHRQDGELWFVSAQDSSAAEEIDGDMRAAVIMQSKGQYARLTGMASVKDDRDLLESLWSPLMRPWFPDGTGSDQIVAIRFVAMEGEYWDTTGLEGIKYVFKALSAAVRGQTPDHESPALHGTVQM